MEPNQYVSLTPEQAEFVGNAVMRRRVERGYRSARSFAAASGLDYRTITHIESARRDQVSRSTLAIIESTLGWNPGQITAMIRTGKIPSRTIQLEVPPDAEEADVRIAFRAAQAAFTAVLDGKKQTRQDHTHFG